MQQVIFHPARHTKFQTQATYMLPGHGRGGSAPASNDDHYHDKQLVARLVFSVLANVVGGTLLLSSLLFLPHVVAEFLL